IHKRSACTRAVACMLHPGSTHEGRSCPLSPTGLLQACRGLAHRACEPSALSFLALALPRPVRREKEMLPDLVQKARLNLSPPPALRDNCVLLMVQPSARHGSIGSDLRP